MGHPASMPTRPTNPSMSGSDLAVSIAALDTGHRGGPLRNVLARVSVSRPAGELTITIVRLYRRRLAWPFAIGTLGLCLFAFFVGAVGYAVAIGA